MASEGYSANGILDFLSKSSEEEILEKYCDCTISEGLVSEEYIFEQLQTQHNIYTLLDAAPVFITAKAHRPVYGSDGDYFSKPNAEMVFERLYGLMHESHPLQYP